MNDIQTRLVSFRETLRQKQKRTMLPIILFGLDFFVLKFLLYGNCRGLWSRENLQFCPKRTAESCQQSSLGREVRAAEQIGKEIWLAMHPRNFGPDKIGRSSTPHVSGCEMAHLQLGSKAYTIYMSLTWYWKSM